MMKKSTILFWGLLLLSAGRRADAQSAPDDSLRNYLRSAVFSLTVVMAHDAVDPPAASRYYSYAMLGAYDLVSGHDTAVVPALSFIRHYGEKDYALSDRGYDYRIAAVWSILETGKMMLPSGKMLADAEAKFLQQLDRWDVPQEIVDRSLPIGELAAEKAIAFSKGDRYHTAPNWRILRPMVIDSGDQFMPPPLTPFSKDKNSDFYNLAMEVYKISKDTGAQSLYERTIAGFWEKISPGGHWMDISANAAKEAGLNFDRTVEVQTLVAVTLMDAFIACWDEKSPGNRIRPAGYINRYIDPHWQPYLQTPLFPEYTSVHSVISTASAEVLTYLLGTQLDYTDNAEELWDIKPRSFHSFRDAAAEAAISQLYGGIHYRDAVMNGQVQGKVIADYIIGKLKEAGVRPLR